MRDLRVKGNGHAGGPKVVLGYPVGGSVTLPFHVSVLQLLAYELAKPDHSRLLSKITHTSGLYVADNRTMLVQRFLETDADWLLQVDTDIEFPVTLVETMLRIAGDDRKIVAANVPLGVYASVAFMETKTPGIWDCLETLPADVFQCDGAATAVYLAHRDVFKAIAAEHGQCWFHHMYLPKSPEGTPPWAFKFQSIGEDLAFSLRAKRSGFQTWVARVPGLGHHKTRKLSHDQDWARAMAAEDPGVGEIVQEEA